MSLVEKQMIRHIDNVIDYFMCIEGFDVSKYAMACAFYNTMINQKIHSRDIRRGVQELGIRIEMLNEKFGGHIQWRLNNPWH